MILVVISCVLRQILLVLKGEDLKHSHVENCVTTCNSDDSVKYDCYF